MTLKTKKRNFGGSVGNFGRKYERKVIMNFCPGSGQTCTLVFIIKPLISKSFSNLELSLIHTCQTCPVAVQWKAKILLLCESYNRNRQPGIRHTFTL